MNGLIVDNFAGGGGASIGLERALGRPVDIAINHDRDAIAMHTANHPHTQHLTEDVFRVSPRKICRGRDVDVAWFSPDCTHFSKAKGGNIKRSRKIRGLAWVAVKWADQVQPRLICLENVEEFMTWGPLTKSGKPNKARAGQYFRKFVRALENHGYIVEWKVLTACDYGAPTSRKRFFLIARCDGEPIVWPDPTHGDVGAQHAVPGLLPYRTAAECIDWSIPTVSIFATQEECRQLGINCIRPLAENTLKRIARGVVKFILNAPSPYILNDEQMGLLSASLITIDRTKSGPEHRAHSVDKPFRTITQRNNHALVSAFLAKYHNDSGDRCARPDEPLRTIDTANRFGIVTSFLTKFKGTNIGSDLRDPMQTILAGGLHHAQVTAFLIKYYGQGIGQTVGEPLTTILSKEKFGLVTVNGDLYHIEDIGLRMLRPHELAAAQGFPRDYKLTGTGASQVARIGNSVPPDVVAAIVKANANWHEQSQAEAA